jgi:hypothetical protein
VNFSDALNYIKRGYFVRRTFPSPSWCLTEVYLTGKQIWYSSMEGGTKRSFPWVPRYEDLLADDWELLPSAPSVPLEIPSRLERVLGDW